MSQGKVTTQITGDPSGLTDALSESENALESFASSIASKLVVTLGDLKGIVDSVVGVFSTLFEQFDEQAVATIQLESVIRATGGAAGFTADQILEWASAMQSTLAVSDQTIVSVTALALQFKNLQGDQALSAVIAAFELSATKGLDLKSAMNVIGRALEDPIEGMERLDRIGIDLTTTQKKLIRELVRTGEADKARALILDELATRQQSAEALAQRLGGRLDFAKVKAGELAEEVFAFLSPAIEELVSDFVFLIVELVDLVKWMNELATVTNEVGETFNTFAIAFETKLAPLKNGILDIIALLATLMIQIDAAFSGERIEGVVESFRNIREALEAGPNPVRRPTPGQTADRDEVPTDDSKGRGLGRLTVEKLAFAIEDAAAKVDLKILSVNQEQLVELQEINESLSSAGGGSMVNNGIVMV